ncbi:MAG: ABC transporter ATP-binding protein [Deltaproteobacteria bacterium]|nr:ABC transporter ATP-binding protein [Deltaproteobacteria bacterium]
MSNRQQFITDEHHFSGKYSRRLLQTLHASYQPFLLPLVGFMFLGFVARLLFLSNANLIGYWIDGQFTKEHSSDWLRISNWARNWNAQDFLAVLLLLNVSGFILILVYRICFSRLSCKAVSRLYDEVTYRTSRYSISFFDRTPTGRVVTRFASDFNNVFRIFGGPLAEFLSIVFDMVAIIGLITLAHPIYLAIIGVIATGDYLVYRLHRDSLRRERRSLAFFRAPSIAHFAESLLGVRSIRTYLRQSTFENRFARLDNEFSTQKLKTFQKVTLFAYKMNIVSGLFLLFTGVFAFYLQSRGIVSVGSIGVAITFVTIMSNTLQIFFEWLAQLEEALTGIERLDQYLHQPIESGGLLPKVAEFPTEHWGAPSSNMPLPLSQDSKFVVPTAAQITVSNLWFRYQPHLPWVLKGISFTVAAGEKLGVVGRTGSGKSSLVQALFYLYPFERGEISVNGLAPLLNASETTQPNRIYLHTYRKYFSLITQEPVLFNASLRENLLMGTIGVSDDELLLSALDRVGLLDWLEAQAEGLDFMIQEKGRNISQGEKQKICMARSLLQDCPVVIFDEATSAVDPQNEEMMVKASNDFFRHRTQIIIAHRLSTLERCTRTLWLEEGQIRMIGPTQEVLSQFESGFTKVSNTRQ